MRVLDWSKVWRKDVPWYKNFRMDWRDLMLLVVVLLLVFSYRHDNAEYMKVAADPCAYCGSCLLSDGQPVFNWSGGTYDDSGLVFDSSG